MKGLILGCLFGVVLLAFSGLIVLTSLVHPMIPLVVAGIMVISLFGYVGYRGQQ